MANEDAQILTCECRGQIIREVVIADNELIIEFLGGDRLCLLPLSRAVRDVDLLPAQLQIILRSDKSKDEFFIIG